MAYTLVYQLGGRGKTYSSLEAAVRGLRGETRRLRAAGDEQGVRIVRLVPDDGGKWLLDEPLSDEEAAAVEAACR